jgi:superfamily II DNA helicase RecQ
MEDQVQNLRSRDVAAETLHASTPQTEVKAILKRMLGSAGAPKGKGKKKVVIEEEEEHTEVKLVYVRSFPFSHLPFFPLLVLGHLLGHTGTHRQSQELR